MRELERFIIVLGMVKNTLMMKCDGLPKLERQNVENCKSCHDNFGPKRA